MHWSCVRDAVEGKEGSGNKERAENWWIIHRCVLYYCYWSLLMHTHNVHVGTVHTKTTTKKLLWEVQMKDELWEAMYIISNTLLVTVLWAHAKREEKDSKNRLSSNQKYTWNCLSNYIIEKKNLKQKCILTKMIIIISGLLRTRKVMH